MMNSGGFLRMIWLFAIAWLGFTFLAGPEACTFWWDNVLPCAAFLTKAVAGLKVLSMMMVSSSMQVSDKKLALCRQRRSHLTSSTLSDAKLGVNA
jgi:hypothetical protein